jgi:hypothetical protein
MTMTPEAQAAGLIILGLSLIGNVVSSVMAVVGRIQAGRRVPPIDQTLAADYVRSRDFETCQERCARDLARIEARHEASTREVFGVLRTQQAEIGKKLDGMQTELSSWQRAVAQQIGNIEGRVDRLEEHRG